MVVSADVCPYPMPDVKSTAIELKVKPGENSLNTAWQALIVSDSSYQFDNNKIKLIFKLNPEGDSVTDYVSFKTENVRVEETTLTVIREDTMEEVVLSKPVS